MYTSHMKDFNSKISFQSNIAKHIVIEETVFRCSLLLICVVLFRAGIKGLFVLMPILGVGWVLGLFALNKSTIVFEYAFAIVNGFQVREMLLSALVPP